MLLEQILKLDCEWCRLRTEHYTQIRDDVILVCRCLRCGHVNDNLQSVSHERPYPADDRRPIYVV